MVFVDARIAFVSVKIIKIKYKKKLEFWIICLLWTLSLNLNTNKLYIGYTENIILPLINKIT